MSSVARIRAYIDSHGIKKSEFYLKTGLSNGYLDKVKDIGADKIEKILSAYPDIDLYFLITGKTAISPPESEDINSLEGTENVISPLTKGSFVTDSVTPPVTPTLKNTEKSPIYPVRNDEETTHLLHEPRAAYGLTSKLTDTERINRLETLLKGIQDLLNESNL